MRGISPAPAGAAVRLAPGGRAGDYVCVACGAAMRERACRVGCPRCGYFEDCANGLTPPPVDRPARRGSEGERRS